MNENEHFKHNVVMRGNTIYLDNENELVVENTQKRVGNSFETPSLGGNENLGPIQATSDIQEGNAVKRIFNLMDFYQFYEALLTFVSVDGTDLLGPFDIGQVKNKKRKSVNLTFAPKSKQICRSAS